MSQSKSNIRPTLTRASKTGRFSETGLWLGNLFLIGTIVVATCASSWKKIWTRCNLITATFVLLASLLVWNHRFQQFVMGYFSLHMKDQKAVVAMYVTISLLFFVVVLCVLTLCREHFCDEQTKQEVP